MTIIQLRSEMYNASLDMSNSTKKLQVSLLRFLLCNTAHILSTCQGNSFLFINLNKDSYLRNVERRNLWYNLHCNLSNNCGFSLKTFKFKPTFCNLFFNSCRGLCFKSSRKFLSILSVVEILSFLASLFKSTNGWMTRLLCSTGSDIWETTVLATESLKRQVSVLISSWTAFNPFTKSRGLLSIIGGQVQQVNQCWNQVSQQQGCKFWF